MQLPYFYFEGSLETGTAIVLPEDTSRHIVQVLRMQHGETLQLTNGLGILALCTITEAHKKHCVVQVAEVEKFEKKTASVHIAISPLKNNSRFEWFLEKATELGISAITPLICNRTEKQHLKTERLGGILISALLQSRQVFLPQLMPPQKYAACIEAGFDGQRLIAHCLPHEKTELSHQKIQGPVQIFIGPEGDFSEEEIQYALTSGFKAVALGSTRLRTETAGIAAAVLLVNK